MSRLLALGVLLLLPAVVAADVGPPVGQKLVPQDVILEVGEDARNYQFWLAFPRTLEPLPLVPGQPYRISQGLNNLFSYGNVIAVPHKLVDAMGEQELRRALQDHKQQLPGVVVAAQPVFFGATLPADDTRECVTLRYRLEILEGKVMNLVFLGDNAHENTSTNQWPQGPVAVVGILLSGIAMWLGLRIVRRKQQPQLATQ